LRAKREQINGELMVIKLFTSNYASSILKITDINT
jgi:hypothetical protein